MRIVSLVPSLTKTVCDLGLRERLVGCTDYCVDPKGLRRSIPSVRGTKNPDLSAIRSLQPTHILTNSEENKPEHIEELKCSIPEAEVVETRVHSARDCINLVHLVAAKLGVPKSLAEALLRPALQQLEQMETKRLELQNSQSYVYLIWRNPWMAAGNQCYISHLLELAGLENAITTTCRAQDVYPTLTDCHAETIKSAHVLLFSSEPFPFKKRHMEEFSRSWHRSVEDCLKVDGKALSWFGSSLIEGLQEATRIRRWCDEHRANA